MLCARIGQPENEALEFLKVYFFVDVLCVCVCVYVCVCDLNIIRGEKKNVKPFCSTDKCVKVVCMALEHSRL